MYQWSPEMIRFMQNASEYGIYHKQLAKLIAEQIPTESTVCDVGCGLGYLSLKLANFVKKVIAIDINKDVTDILIENKIREKTENLNVICEDINAYFPEKKFDAMVFCFFGKIDEVLAIVKKNCKGKAFVISRSWGEHRFSVTPQGANKLTSYKVCDILSEMNIPFRIENFVAQLGQPFESKDDAVLFFKTYNKDKTVQSITFDSISDQLVPIDDPKFKYYLPMVKEMCLISFNSEDIP